MGINSKIEWTENTFNPWIGCTRISPACDHCYAADLSARTFKVKWGAGEQRKRTSESYWKQPLKWGADYEDAYQRYSDASIVGCSATEPKRPRVFCASLADVFDNEVDPQWRVDLFRLIESTPNLDWMILTKRIGNARAMSQAAMGCIGVMHKPLPSNLHLGITICNQDEADLWVNWTGAPSNDADGDVSKSIAVMGRHGKKAAGRLLDGVEHNGRIAL